MLIDVTLALLLVLSWALFFWLAWAARGRRLGSTYNPKLDLGYLMTSPSLRRPCPVMENLAYRTCQTCGGSTHCPQMGEDSGIAASLTHHLMVCLSCGSPMLCPHCHKRPMSM